MRDIIFEGNDPDIMAVANELSGKEGVGDISFTYSSGGKKYRVTGNKDKVEITNEATIKIKIPTKISHEDILSVTAFLRRLADLHNPSNEINQDAMCSKILGAINNLSKIFKDIDSDEDKASIYGNDLTSAVRSVMNKDYDDARVKIVKVCENLSDITFAKIIQENLNVNDIGKQRFFELAMVEETFAKIKDNGNKISKKSLDKINEACLSIGYYDIVSLLEESGLEVEEDFIKENNEKFLGDI